MTELHMGDVWILLIIAIGTPFAGLLVRGLRR